MTLNRIKCFSKQSLSDSSVQDGIGARWGGVGVVKVDKKDHQPIRFINVSESGIEWQLVIGHREPIRTWQVRQVPKGGGV